MRYCTVVLFTDRPDNENKTLKRFGIHDPKMRRPDLKRTVNDCKTTKYILPAMERGTCIGYKSEPNTLYGERDMQVSNENQDSTPSTACGPKLRITIYIKTKD